MTHEFLGTVGYSNRWWLTVKKNDDLTHVDENGLAK